MKAIYETKSDPHNAFPDLRNVVVHAAADATDDDTTVDDFMAFYDDRDENTRG